jgi:hypothetical protein
MWYTPCLFDSISSFFPMAVPLVAIVTLWLARSSENSHWQKFAETTYIAALLVVAWGTLRTILCNDSCWLMHTGSMGVMVVGGIFPFQQTNAVQP